MSVDIDIYRERGHHPARSPDWRWRLACYIRNGPVGRFRGAEADDEYIRIATRIQKANQDHQSREELGELLAGAGPVKDAYDFWQDCSSRIETSREVAKVGGDKPEFQPVPPGSIDLASLEAYILTGESSRKISEHIPMLPAAIDAYEKVFFDVRDRLKYSSWVSNRAIGALHQVGPLTMIPNLIRAYGYYTGSIDIAKKVAETFDAAILRKVTDPGQVFDADRRDTQARQAALAARMLNLNRYTYEKILAAQNETLEVDAKLKQSVGSMLEEQFRESVEVFSKALDWGYGQEPTNLAGQRSLAATPLQLVESSGEVV